MRQGFPYCPVVLVFLRCLGITNAAIWFGAAIFFTAAVNPAFSSVEMVELLRAPWATVGAANILLDRYFTVQCWCSAVALAHLAGERLYTGQKLRRWRLILAIAVFAWSLLGSQWLHPKLQRLHIENYAVRSTQEQRTRAQRSYRIWHGFFQGVNVLVLFGLFAHLMSVTASTNPPRFISSGKFRG